MQEHLSPHRDPQDTVVLCKLVRHEIWLALSMPILGIGNDVAPHPFGTIPLNSCQLPWTHGGLELSAPLRLRFGMLGGRFDNLTLVFFASFPAS